MQPKTRNSVTVKTFEHQELVTLINSHSGRDSKSKSFSQLDYLSNYLQKLEAKTILVESRYVDRHYIEEFSTYYSKLLHSPTNVAARIHFFNEPYSESDFFQRVESASKGELEAVTADLQRAYLGYIVIRPIPSVPIGRTVLATWASADRTIEVVDLYEVHVLGLRLTVRGLAFQQQDQGAGACATTAIWSALQRATRVEGNRAITPPDITAAAYKFLLPFGREETPSLTNEQMAEAIRSFGFAPQYLCPDFLGPSFLACIHIYLSSGMPVILTLKQPDKDEAHAVTLVGYHMNEGDRLAPTPPVTVCSQNINFVGTQIDKVYLHDDRLGPYARANWKLKKGAAGIPYVLHLSLEFPGKKRKMEQWAVSNAWVPLYPKLRRSAVGLLNYVALVYPTLLSCIANDSPGDLVFGARFERAGDYLEALHSRKLPPDAVRHFLCEVMLSRYVGVLIVYVKGVVACEFLLDTTDTDRQQFIEPKLDAPLAVVCLERAYWDALKPIADFFSTPFL